MKAVDFFALWMIAWAVPSLASEPTNPFIDYGACPGECCSYGLWQVTSDTNLLESIGSNKIVGKARAQSFVIAVTGEVHTRPGRIRILKNRDPYSAGDIVHLLTPTNIGQYVIMFKGKTYSDSTDVINMVADPALSGSAKLEREPISHWWIQILLNDGTLGWTTRSSNFKVQNNPCGPSYN